MDSKTHQDDKHFQIYRDGEQQAGLSMGSSFVEDLGANIYLLKRSAYDHLVSSEEEVIDIIFDYTGLNHQKFGRRMKMNLMQIVELKNFLSQIVDEYALK